LLILICMLKSLKTRTLGSRLVRWKEPDHTFSPLYAPRIFRAEAGLLVSECGDKHCEDMSYISLIRILWKRQYPLTERPSRTIEVISSIRLCVTKLGTSCFQSFWARPSILTGGVELSWERVKNWGIIPSHIRV
jgi:hypothetical protein